MPQNVIDLIMADHRVGRDPENRPAPVAEPTATFVAHGRAEETKVYSEPAEAVPSERVEVHHEAEELSSLGK
uniref:hypothetical protein n=1 Tax=Herbidospora sakaeratensis TaxID=564415 RepID=UPI0007846179|nr:hypothetical protein [Herbidospora sakaeratensis]